MERTWYRMETHEVLTTLHSSREGLRHGDVEARRAQDGPNVLPKPARASFINIALRQFRGLFVAVLIGAAIVSAALGDTVDAIVIAAAVLVNVFVGFTQEFRAERSLAALNRALAQHALVRRDGREHLIDAVDLVVGDVLLLRLGENVVADARLLEVHEFEVNEALLTGESSALPKTVHALKGERTVADAKNMVFAGTVVVRGRALAVVTAIGGLTELGAIARSLKSIVDVRTPLQERLHRLSKRITALVFVIAIALFVLGLGAGKSVADIFALSVAIAVAAIPEGLVVAVTAILAVGAQRMFRRKGLMRHLASAETLGSTDVICTDKTGTLTEGSMAVVQMRSIGTLSGRAGYAADLQLLTIGLLANEAHIESEEKPLHERVVIGTPTERALVAAAHANGLTRRELLKQYHQLDLLPFDSGQQYMAALFREKDKRHVVFYKGAPEKIMGFSSYFDEHGTQHALTAGLRATVRDENERLSQQGLRVLALAYRTVPDSTQSLHRDGHVLDDAVFVGLVALQDPLREEAVDTLARCRRAGITAVMMTGDHPFTARSIARELGLATHASEIVTGEELLHMTDQALAERIGRIRVFARVSPIDKLRIVRAWQAHGSVVAMTGDGVNDAPALKAADIGVALGSGTDVAKEAADLVLLDDNFSTIVAAVEQGRVIFDNIKKIVLYLLSDSFSEVVVFLLMFVVLAFDASFPFPLLAAQILWINLIADGIPNMALTFEPGEGDVMRLPPRKKEDALISRGMRRLIGTISLLKGLLAFGAFLAFWKMTDDAVYARTVAFMILGISSLLYVFSVKQLRTKLSFRSITQNVLLLVAVVFGCAVQLATMYVPQLARFLGVEPIGWLAWTVVLGSAVGIIVVIELTKRRLIGRKEFV